MKLLLAFVLLLSVSSAHAQSPDAAAGYNAFKLVKTRNIFDPERRPIRPDAVRTAGPAAPRANFLVLTGTMVTSARTLAFFRGSQPDYSKIIPEGASVADCTVKRITATQVELERAGKPLVLIVGQQVPLGDSASVPTAAAPEAEVAAPAPATPADASAPEPPAAPGGSNDVLRRMMERRQKELSK